MGELVWAGHEPLEFTNLFPSWTHHIDIQTLNYKFVGDSSVDRTFALLSRDNYSWVVKILWQLPDGNSWKFEKKKGFFEEKVAFFKEKRTILRKEEKKSLKTEENMRKRKRKHCKIKESCLVILLL